MTIDLIRPLDLTFEKHADDKVSVDPNRWQTDVLKKLAEDYPYLLAGTEVNVVFKAKDEQLGMGFGGIYITNREPQRDRYKGEYDNAETTYDSRNPVAVAEGATKTIIIPIIVSDWKLKPIDVFVMDRQVFPLTEMRVAEALFSNRIFSHAEKEQPGQIIPDYMADASIADKLYPPPESVYGYGAGGTAGSSGIVSYGSADPSLSDLVAPTVRPEHRAEFLSFCKKGNGELESMMLSLSPFMQKMLSASRAYEDSAAVSEIEGHIDPENVVRIRPAVGRDGIYEVTTVHDRHYDPMKSELMMTDVIARYGTMVPDIRERLEAGDTVVLTLNHEVETPIILEDYQVEAEPVVGDGQHILMDRQGDFRTYSVFNQVRLLNGKLLDGAKVFTDGRHWGLQESLIGDSVGEPNDVSECCIKPGITGMFVMPDGAVTVPLMIRSYSVDKCEERLSLTVVDAFGQEHLVIIVPGINRIVSKTGVENSAIGQHLGMNIWYVPGDYPFVEVGQRTTVANHIDQLQRVFHQRMATMVDKHNANQKRFRIDGANTEEEERRREDGQLPTSSLDAEVNPGSHHENLLIGIQKAYGLGRFILHGRILEDTEHATAQVELTEKEALFLLATLGFSLEQGRSLLERAMQSDIHVSNARQPIRMSTSTKMSSMSSMNDLLERIAADLRQPLWKEGAALTMPIRAPRNPEAFVVMRDFLDLEKRAQDEIPPDEQTVDTVLSLGFINPENLAAFMQKLPTMRESEGYLGELLLLLRLGLQGIKEEPVRAALKSLNRVNEALESLGSYGTQSA
jgi:hypothetical protein